MRWTRAWRLRSPSAIRSKLEAGGLSDQGPDEVANGPKKLAALEALRARVCFCVAAARRNITKECEPMDLLAAECAKPGLTKDMLN